MKKKNLKRLRNKKVKAKKYNSLKNNRIKETDETCHNLTFAHRPKVKINSFYQEDPTQS